MQVFDFICQELSLALGEPIVGAKRFDLWIAMASWGWHPLFNARDTARAATCLEQAASPLLDKLRQKLGAPKLEKLLQQVANFNPDQPTPEEVFERIGKA